MQWCILVHFTLMSRIAINCPGRDRQWTTEDNPPYTPESENVKGGICDTQNHPLPTDSPNENSCHTHTILTKSTKAKLCGALTLWGREAGPHSSVLTHQWLLLCGAERLGMSHTPQVPTNILTPCPVTQPPIPLCPTPSTTIILKLLPQNI